MDQDYGNDDGSMETELLHAAQPARHRLKFPGAVKKTAYSFDGYGKFSSKDWDLKSRESEGFSWYHVELPRSNQRLTLAAQYLIDILCPPLKLQEILALVSNGPYCGSIDGALVFRVNSAGPTTSQFTHKIAALVTDDRVISVSLGRIPRLEFSSVTAESLLQEVPRLESDLDTLLPSPGITNSRGITIQEHVLDFLLTMNHPEHADNPIPKCVSNLLVHIIDTHVDQLQDIVIKLEMDLDNVERELDTGGYVVKKEMLDDRRFPKMHLDLQRLLQVIAHGEQVFPRMKDKCAGKKWCTPEDVGELDVLVGRLHKLKENVGFIASRITAIQAGLDSWQAEQINRKLYYLSFLSMIFLPLSIVTGAFGMNVGGVPWTKQNDLTLSHGFRNVMFICAIIVVMLLACFGASPLYSYLSTRRKNQAARKKWLGSKKSIRIRNGQRGSYLPLNNRTGSMSM
ncbi:hypothetical protein Mapa_010877 [Marchantia paleacea]|nr:hypothetical protein Mapa_010877 [Marchantia paleacea]